MCLKTAQWTEGITPEASPESESDSAATAVGNLVNSLTTQRVYREVTLALAPCSSESEAFARSLSSSDPSPSQIPPSTSSPRPNRSPSFKIFPSFVSKFSDN
ncbi:hypothetical protein M0R45_009446 [Rubus argutus]|uniref:Uncharacterized protein n=1 Tax=Rubus argutus TaxID=59490 RepID=A0AAW1Y423_RUBAR